MWEKGWNLWLEYLLKTSSCASSHGLLGRYCQHINVVSSVGFYGYRSHTDSLGGKIIQARKFERMRTPVVERRHEQKEVLQS